MKIEESILRSLHPERDSFTDEEISAVRRGMLFDGGKTGKVRELPLRFVPLGGEFVVGGKRYVCFRAPRDLNWVDACMGCAFKRLSCHSNIPQCSPFDRRDGIRVWFREVRDD